MGEGELAAEVGKQVTSENFVPADLLGLLHHWVLVHRVAGERHSVSCLGV